MLDGIVQVDDNAPAEEVEVIAAEFAVATFDLIEEFGQEPGFWKAFADGVEAIEVKQGHLLIKLKE